MLLISVEVSVKIACWSTTVTDCSHKAITMQLILVERLVKIACQSHSYLYATYPGGSIYECGLSVHDSHRLKVQSYFYATYPHPIDPGGTGRQELPGMCPCIV